MKTLTGRRDRSKASEHAIVIWRDLDAPLGTVLKLLPRLAKHPAEHLTLIVPGAGTEPSTRPVELVLTPSSQASDWQIELRLPHAAGSGDFFEGDLRLEGVPPHATRITLLGRFAFGRNQVPPGLNEGALRDIAEDNVIRIFEQLLLEIESAAAVKPHRKPARPRSGQHA